jgi:gluconolactonase
MGTDKHRGSVRFLTDDLLDPEAPVLLSDGRWAVVEMSPARGCVTLIGVDGRDKQILARMGRPNGLAVDAQGVLWVANSDPPCLIRLELSGTNRVFACGSLGEPFLWPNDLCFGPDGAIYLTDSGVHPAGWLGLDPERRAKTELDGRVYRVDVETGAVDRIDRGLRFANGIAFGLDKRLYVSESLTGNIVRYDWDGAQIVGERQLFGNVWDPALDGEPAQDGRPGMSGGPGGGLGPDGHPGGQPDGMAFGLGGRLFVAVHNRGEVAVLNASGVVQRRISMQGPRVTNLAFGPAGQKRIYTTEANAERVGWLGIYEVDTEGYPLFMGK